MLIAGNVLVGSRSRISISVMGFEVIFIFGSLWSLYSLSVAGFGRIYVLSYEEGEEVVLICHRRSFVMHSLLPCNQMGFQ